MIRSLWHVLRKHAGPFIGVALLAVIGAFATVRLTDSESSPQQQPVPNDAIRETRGFAVINRKHMLVNSAIVTQNRLGKVVIRLLPRPQSCDEGNLVYSRNDSFVEVEVVHTPIRLGDLRIGETRRGNAFRPPAIDYVRQFDREDVGHVVSDSDGAELLITHMGTQSGDIWYGEVRARHGQPISRERFNLDATFAAPWCGS